MEEPPPPAALDPPILPLEDVVHSPYVVCSVGRPCADAVGHDSFCFDGDCAAPGYSVGATIAKAMWLLQSRLLHRKSKHCCVLTVIHV
jgi:hypothetical protein